MYFLTTRSTTDKIFAYQLLVLQIIYRDINKSTQCGTISYLQQTFIVASMIIQHILFFFSRTIRVKSCARSKFQADAAVTASSIIFHNGILVISFVIKITMYMYIYIPHKSTHYTYAYLANNLLISLGIPNETRYLKILNKWV